MFNYLGKRRLHSVLIGLEEYMKTFPEPSLISFMGDVRILEIYK